MSVLQERLRCSHCNVNRSLHGFLNKFLLFLCVCLLKHNSKIISEYKIWHLNWLAILSCLDWPFVCLNVSCLIDILVSRNGRKTATGHLLFCTLVNGLTHPLCPSNEAHSSHSCHMTEGLDNRLLTHRKIKTIIITTTVP